MSKPIIKWKMRGFQEIRRSERVEALLHKEVERVLTITGRGDDDGYNGGVSRGRTRSRGYVLTYTPHAFKENAEQHTLLRALMASKEV